MKVLLAYLLVTFLLALWAAKRGRPPRRTWVLVLVTFVVAGAYLARRAY